MAKIAILFTDLEDGTMEVKLVSPKDEPYDEKDLTSAQLAASAIVDGFEASKNFVDTAIEFEEACSEAPGAVKH